MFQVRIPFVTDDLAARKTANWNDLFIDIYIKSKTSDNVKSRTIFAKSKVHRVTPDEGLHFSEPQKGNL